MHKKESRLDLGLNKIFSIPDGKRILEGGHSVIVRLFQFN
ncbi:Putative uncharacterized protein [Moritella viscosa]|uniref:Uncharacterized protein n=1 Tax=Moritella viscosa TaxID=80854 RepID=A0A1L0AK76_9GAMM|nr:Putative uncharacterized protein [Moritella viscosa]SHN99253.1 Putative uncharacterized protein [Moritella viscosa]SHO01560.1 Putative uncharacterized protein [Moritella viscosa]